MTGDAQRKLFALRIVMAMECSPAQFKALGNQPQLGVYRWLKVAKGLHGKTMHELAKMYLECVFSV